MPLDSGSVLDVSNSIHEGGGDGVCSSVCTPIETHELEAAIVAVTRALAATVDPDLAAELVGERRALRHELETASASEVVPVAAGTRCNAAR